MSEEKEIFEEELQYKIKGEQYSLKDILDLYYEKLYGVRLEDPIKEFISNLKVRGITEKEDQEKVIIALDLLIKEFLSKNPELGPKGIVKILGNALKGDKYELDSFEGSIYKPKFKTNTQGP